MRIGELKQALLQRLQLDLAGHGFRLVKSKDWFIRMRPGIKDFFLLDFSQYDYLAVQPTVRLRIDSVEDMFHRTSGFEERFQSETPTLAASLQNLSGRQDLFEYRVSTLAEIGSVGAQLLQDFERLALPYFERNASLNQIDLLLNDDPQVDSIHYLMDYLRCSHGLIVAKLTDRANYTELVEIYRRRMERFSDGFYLPNFELLVDDLSKLLKHHYPA